MKTTLNKGKKDIIYIPMTDVTNHTRKQLYIDSNASNVITELRRYEIGGNTGKRSDIKVC